MVDTLSLNKLLQLARQVQAEYTDSKFPDCQSLLRRCNRLEHRLIEPNASRSLSSLLWIDEVRIALSVALEAAKRVKDYKAEPQPTGIRAVLAKLRGHQPPTAVEREFETIRASSRVIHEWLAAYSAMQRQCEADNDDDSLVSLGDSGPYLLDQYVPCHKAERTSAKQIIVAALKSKGETASLVFVRGARGVGKSVLATLLVRDPEVTHHFSSGTRWIQLGQDSSEEDVCDELAEMVDTVSAGSFLQSVRHEMSLDAIIGRAEGRLAAFSLLVVIDDVCGKWGREALNGLIRILGPNSVILVTSANDIGTLVEAIPSSTKAFQVEVSPVDPVGEESSHVFNSWLYNQPIRDDEQKARIKSYKKTILHACKGFPLALAMAAGSVSKCPEAWERVASTLAFATISQCDLASAEAAEDVEPDITDVITLLLDELLDRGDAHFGSQMRALAALPRGQWVSLKTLAKLWGVSDTSVKASARRLVKLSFGAYRLSDSSEQSAVRLCWHVSNYCLGLVSPDELAIAHQKLLSRCLQRNIDDMSSGSTISDTSWDITLRDQYLRRRFCWHMACAGAFNDLRSLLCEYSWIVNRLDSSTSYGLRLDIDLYITLARGVENDTGLQAFEQVLKALKDLSRSGRGQTAGRANFAPILAARLKELEENDAVSGALLKSVYRDAPRPWLKPMYQVECEPVLSRTISNSQQESGETEDDAFEKAVDRDDEFEIEGGGNYIVCTTCNSLGHAIAGEASGRIYVWDVRTGERLAVFDTIDQDSKKSLLGALACMGNDTVVSGHSRGTLRLWSISRGIQVHELCGHDESDVITALATYGPSTIVSGTDSGAIFMWHNVFADKGPATVRMVRLTGENDEITALCVLPGGTRVVTGSYDGFAAIWDISMPNSIRISLNGHKDYVTMFAPVADGRRVASTCRGGSVNVWDSSTGSRLWSMMLGYEFSCIEALSASASHNYNRSRSQAISPLGAKVGFPYFCSRGELSGELIVVTSVGQNEIVASTQFGGHILDWSEVWHPGNNGIYVVVALENGSLTTAELVTAL